MKQHLLIYSLIAVLLSSCYGVEKPKKPDNLISQDKMVEVLVELALVSSAKGINKRELENKGLVPDAYVYKKHKIDSTQFVQSNNYYAFDIEVYTEIYQKVKDSLEALRVVYKEVLKEEDDIKQKELKETLKAKKSNVLKRQ